MTGSPPRDLAAVNHLLDQLLLAICQIYPGAPHSYIGRPRNLNRKLTEHLLGGCATALLPFIIEPTSAHTNSPRNSQATQAESPPPVAESAVRHYVEDLAGKFFPQRPPFLQPSHSHPAIAAAERAFAERQQSAVSPTAQVRTPLTADHHEQSEVPSSSQLRDTTTKQ
jgi:hypothetical protein